MYKRLVENEIGAYLKSKDHKIFFVWGPRRSGKTTLIKKLAAELKVSYYNFDFISDREKFIADREVLTNLVKTNKVILIDEVQNYPAGTIPLKLLVDEFKVKIIATGSSEIRQKTGQDFDSLAGRFSDNYCLPFSVSEIVNNHKIKPDEKVNFEQKLAADFQIYGAYPEVYTTSSKEQKIVTLQNILDTYVIKDITNIYDLRNDKLAKDILLKIALQLGSEVSIRELADSLGANAATVTSYIEIFIKNYILFPLPSFKTNLRKAVSENKKYYFYDLGIRNILVRDFRELDFRPDKGGLLENFILLEFEKKRRNEGLNYNFYFYREYGGQEIDLIIEDYNKKYTCVEIKTKKGGINKIFPLPGKYEVITGENYFQKLASILR